MPNAQEPESVTDRAGRVWTPCHRQEPGEPTHYQTVGSALALTADVIRQLGRAPLRY